jgi:hypothetical protein
MMKMSTKPESEMNKIVRTHYPIEKLPVDLQVGFSHGKTVTVTLQEEPFQSPLVGSKDAIAQMKAVRDRMPTTLDDPVGRIRQLRDEWED